MGTITSDEKLMFSVEEWGLVSDDAHHFGRSESEFDENTEVLVVWDQTEQGTYRGRFVLSADDLADALQLRPQWR